MTFNYKASLQKFLQAKGIEISLKNEKLFYSFSDDNNNIELIKTILENQELLMKNWEIKAMVMEISDMTFMIPNAKIGQAYEAFLEDEKYRLNDLKTFELQGLEALGLYYNSEMKKIEGIPERSGDFKLKMLFSLKIEPENTPPHERTISLIVNPNPRDLWKDIPSDNTAIFWKEDDVMQTADLGEKQIVVASKRGRSHKNVGSFREDDFAFRYFEKTGWSVSAVSDGAGSYSLSRMGSKLACNAIIEYFEQNQDSEISRNFENRLLEYADSKAENLLTDIQNDSKKYLYEAVKFAHQKLKEHAEQTFVAHPELFNHPKAKNNLEYYHATLIFALFKKYDFGYVILTFGVGDCPIAVMNKEQTEITLLNKLDVGEFGGGTRFVTQPDIFLPTAELPMSSRFNFKIMPDFSYLFLMTDGIYDPKFVVEANLEKQEKWLAFLQDLNGENEDKSKVVFQHDNEAIQQQLSTWMDFWSPGNHDDRTLAVVF